MDSYLYSEIAFEVQDHFTGDLGIAPFSTADP